jgi:secondary thiamine-phosphate synthase enzyme
MIFHAESFVIRTSGRGTTEITDRVEVITTSSRARNGLCSVFIHHTSASLILCENADPSVRRDLERFAQRLVPDGDRLFEHDDEGPDDMPAHVRSILTTSTLTIPIADGSLALGTWQGIYLWEHRTRPHSRKLTVSVVGIG